MKKIDPDFKPTDQSIKNLAKHGVLPDFIDDQLPAFITYWTETGKKKASWQMTFQTWMRRSHQGKAGREWEQNRHIRERYKTGLKPDIFADMFGITENPVEQIEEIQRSIKPYRLPDPPPPGPAMSPEEAFNQLRKIMK